MTENATILISQTSAASLPSTGEGEGREEKKSRPKHKFIDVSKPRGERGGNPSINCKVGKGIIHSRVPIGKRRCPSSLNGINRFLQVPNRSDVSVPKPMMKGKVGVANHVPVMRANKMARSAFPLPPRSQFLSLYPQIRYKALWKDPCPTSRRAPGLSSSVTPLPPKPVTFMRS